MSLKKAPKKTLGERLADLINPVTPADEDPENADLGARLIEHDETLYDEDDSSTSRLIADRSSLRAQLDVDELGVAYRGKRVSRAKLQQQSEEEDDDEEEEQDEDQQDNQEEDDDDDDQQQEQDDEDEQQEQDDDMEEDEGDENEMNGHDDDEDDDDDSDISEHDIATLMGADNEALKAEQIALQQQVDMFSESAKPVEQQSSSTLDQASHVQHQKQLWDACLNLHIRLHPSLTIASRLPHYTNTHIYRKDAKINTAYQHVISVCADVLDELITLQHTLMSQNEKVMESIKTQGKNLPTWIGRKRKRDEMGEEMNEREGKIPTCEEYWKHIDQVHQLFSGYRDSSIDLWNRRTQLASGHGATSTFKVLNQSVLTQIATVMQDETRLIKRTQMRRTDGHVIGAEKSIQQEEKRVDALVDGRVEEYDVEIYDDTDYYQQLLREIISHGGDSSAGYDPELLARAERARAKARRGVDRKASKGRKIRYTVMPKLANFMVPQPLQTSAFAVDELFIGLFGQKKQASVQSG